MYDLATQSCSASHSEFMGAVVDLLMGGRRMKRKLFSQSDPEREQSQTPGRSRDWHLSVRSKRVHASRKIDVSAERPHVGGVRDVPVTVHSGWYSDFMSCARRLRASDNDSHKGQPLDAEHWVGPAAKRRRFPPGGLAFSHRTMISWSWDTTLGGGAVSEVGAKGHEPERETEPKPMSSTCAGEQGRTVRKRKFFGELFPAYGKEAQEKQQASLAFREPF